MNTFKSKTFSLLSTAAMLTFCLLFPTLKAEAKTYRVGVLLLGDIRLSTYDGLREGMKNQGFADGKDVTYEVRNAEGDRSKLPDLAKEIIASKPDVAIAAGGVESDALKEASEGTSIPVVFLSVASAADRGLVKSMAEPGGNMTGIDTNDTELTAKRLAYIKKLLPNARRVLIPNIPSLTPSMKAVEVAQKVAPELGLEIVVLDGKNKDEIKAKAATISSANADVIYIGLAAPVWQIQKEVFFPISESQRIPIMGVNRDNLAVGAFASYACDRFETGAQAARLVKKIFEGVPPQKIPVETPSSLEFVVNKWVVDRLGLKLPGKALKLANEIVNIPVN